ncbi:MAG: hypothetical protein IPL01_22490 [Acidobacteria bacterium]|nr:hypothetical protein [Acidobacteriota bacterium]
MVVASPVPSTVKIAADSNGETRNALAAMAEVMFQIPEFEMALSVSLADHSRKFEHSKVLSLTCATPRSTRAKTYPVR